MAAMNSLASALESYRTRDRLIRALGYCCQLVGGVLVEQCSTRSELGMRLLVVSSQLSHCRTILRLFDDLAMFVYTKQYGLGAKEEDVFVRWLSVLGNMADQLYYPCEHVAWAADAKVLHVDSARWWTLSTALWGLSLLLGVVRVPFAMPANVFTGHGGSDMDMMGRGHDSVYWTQEEEITAKLGRSVLCDSISPKLQVLPCHQQKP
uniref:peroxisomal membrane protein 11C isoform X2 n=1 Tax=Jaculus jaculus TaxID=51337 RepID=UPI001E1B42DC|nr:peroxisomal membrane protein 11C isoform X2 [Jaculus jaculus]